MVMIESGSADVEGLIKMADFTEGRLKALGAKTERRKVSRGAGADIVMATYHARDEYIDTGSIEKAAAPVTSRDDPRWQWCEQRHIDHQAGKAPGGATDLAKKLEDDRICAAVYGGQRG